MEKKFVHYYLDAFEQLPTKAKELLFEEESVNENVLIDIVNYIEYIKSPIESILFTAISIFINKHDIRIYIEPQYEIQANKHKYIVDFYICYDEIINNYLKKDFKLIIECDGHEYHHANKKQVENDYNRENDLKLSGCDVIRFTGSQIYKEPMKCAEKIMKYIKLKGVDRSND